MSISTRIGFDISMIFGAILILLQPLGAQKLDRIGSWGVQMKYSTEKSAVVILNVFENTTASNMGIKSQDEIITVNGVSFNNTRDLVKAINEWRENDNLEVAVKREERLLRLNGKVKGKPLETSAHSEVIYGSIDFDQGKLGSILQLPKNVKNPPVILYLPGVGCGSYDFGNDPDHVIKLLVESFLEKGIGVFRVEKPGMGDSFGTKDCLEMDFDYEVSAFKKALETLKSMDQIDPKRIFLFGESLGVISAPLVAKDENIAGIIAWGGVVGSWFEYYLKVQRDQKVILGIDYEKIDQQFKANLPFLYDYLVLKKTPAELRVNPNYEGLLDQQLKDDLWLGLHHYTYFQNLNDKNILSAYKELSCPVLSLAGEFDIHTVDTDWAKTLTKAVNYYHPNNGQYKILPSTTHHYFKVPSIPYYVDLLMNGKLTDEFKAKNFDETIASVISEWVKEQLVP